MLIACDVGSAHADFIGIPPFAFGPPGLVMIAVVFGITTIIEYLVIYLMLGRPKKAGKKLFLCALVLNLITNPPAQLGVWLWGEWFAIELVVIIVESVVLMRIFARMYNSGTLDHSVTGGHSFVIALVANLASFLLGVIGLFGFLFLIHIFSPHPFVLY